MNDGMVNRLGAQMTLVTKAVTGLRLCEVSVRNIGALCIGRINEITLVHPSGSLRTAPHDMSPRSLLSLPSDTSSAKKTELRHRSSPPEIHHDASQLSSHQIETLGDASLTPNQADNASAAFHPPNTSIDIAAA